MRNAGRLFAVLVLLLVGGAAGLVIWNQLGARTTTAATATPVVQTQAPVAQLIQCADGVVRATCPPIAPTSVPAVAAQPQSNPAPTNTSVPQPANTPAP